MRVFHPLVNAHAGRTQKQAAVACRLSYRSYSVLYIHDTPQLQGDAGGSEQFISAWSIASHPDFQALIPSLRSYSFRVAATSPMRLPTRSILHVSHHQG